MVDNAVRIRHVQDLVSSQSPTAVLPPAVAVSSHRGPGALPSSPMAPGSDIHAGLTEAETAPASVVIGAATYDIPTPGLEDMRQHLATMEEK